MLLLEMDLQELLGLEGFGSSPVATFEWARMAYMIISVGFLGIGVDVVVVPNMLTKVVFAFESIVSSIFATVRAWMPRSRFRMAQLVPIHLTRSGGFRTAIGVPADISRMHCVSAMVIELANSIKCGTTLGTVIFKVFVLLHEVINHIYTANRRPTSWNCTKK